MYSPPSLPTPQIPTNSLLIPPLSPAPKGKKLSESSFPFPSTKQGRQPSLMSAMLVPGRSPHGMESKSYLRASMGYGRTPATSGNIRGSQSRYPGQKLTGLTRYRGSPPGGKTFRSQAKAGKSSGNFFEFDSLAGHLLT